jgi:hypothetical protein
MMFEAKGERLGPEAGRASPPSVTKSIVQARLLKGASRPLRGFPTSRMCPESRIFRFDVPDEG